MQNALASVRRSPLTPRTPAAKRKRPAYPIESVDSALRLLHEIVVCERLRVSEAAAKLGVAPSTAHRLLAMLQYHGFVTQDPHTHQYLPGPDLVRFGIAAAKQVDLRKQARPTLEALAKAVNETVHLGLMQGANVLYVDGIECGRVLRIGSRAGAIIPLHCVSMGKAMLAALTRERVDALYPSETLPVLTGRTLTTKPDLLKQLTVIRRNGFASSSGESEEGVTSIATAVVNQNGDVLAAISIAAPATRATPARIRTWVGPLRKAAADLGRHLPYMP